MLTRSNKAFPRAWACCASQKHATRVIAHATLFGTLLVNRTGASCMLTICRPTTLFVTFATTILFTNAFAVTRVPSGDGQYWDIQDTSAWSQDSGGIATGGKA